MNGSLSNDRLYTALFLIAVSLAALAGLAPSLGAQELGPKDFPGLTTPVVLSPFDPNKDTCTAPRNLERMLVFAQDDEREFMQGVRRGLSLAAADRGLPFRVALANSDASRMNEQVEAPFVERAGAVVIAPVDAHAVSRRLRTLISRVAMSARSYLPQLSQC